MSWLTAVLLGLVQGITEFLPVSSSGHLALLQNLFQVEEADLFFDCLLHLGTLIAVVAAYRRDVRAVIRGGLGIIGIGRDRGRTTKKNADRRRMAVFIVVGTVPLLLVLPVRSHVTALYYNTPFICLMLMVTGLVLYLTDRYTAGTRTVREASAGSALLVGLSQVIAVIPGISRSGMTISMGMVCGYRRNYAVRFSLLLSIPAVLGAAIVSFAGALQTGIDGSLWLQYLLGMLAAAVSGFFCIRVLKYLAARSNFGGLAYYCWGAGIVGLLLSLIA